MAVNPSPVPANAADAIAQEAALIDPAHGQIITEVGHIVQTVIAEPGFTTTEFWVTIATEFLALLTMLHVVSFTSDQTQGLIGMAGLILPAVAYAISRGVRKRGTTA